MDFSRQEYWSRLPFPSPGHLPNPGIEPGSPALQETPYCLSHQGRLLKEEIVKVHNYKINSISLFQIKKLKLRKLIFKRPTATNSWLKIKYYISLAAKPMIIPLCDNGEMERNFVPISTFISCLWAVKNWTHSKLLWGINGRNLLLDLLAQLEI